MLLRARWVVPVVSPPVRDGVVRIEDGRISEVRVASARDDAHDLGDVALLPGFVNAHTHLELTGYAGLLPPGPLWDWLAGLVALRRAPGSVAREANAVRRGAALSLAAGVTTVADISRTGRAFDALLQSPIRSICFFELISGAADPPRNAAELRAQALALTNTYVGLSPHALYSVTTSDLRAVAALAAEHKLPVMLHYAESLEELEWLASRTGRMAEFRARFPLPIETQYGRGTPLSLLRESGLIERKPLLAHANYVDDATLAGLAAAGCCVVYCPRAHRFFGHPPHRWREMLAAGINVCVGTDSLASNETLSILDELRFLRRIFSDVSAGSLLEMGTTRPARALGLEWKIGAIHPGACADLTAVPLDEPVRADVESALLDGQRQAVRTWVGGVRVGGDVGDSEI